MNDMSLFVLVHTYIHYILHSHLYALQFPKRKIPFLNPTRISGLFILLPCFDFCIYFWNYLHFVYIHIYIFDYNGYN